VQVPVVGQNFSEHSVVGVHLSSGAVRTRLGQYVDRSIWLGAFPELEANKLPKQVTYSIVSFDNCKLTVLVRGSGGTDE